MRGTAEVEYEYLVPVTINDPKMIDVAAGAAKKIFGEDGVLEAPQMMGGEDFSYYHLQVVKRSLKAQKRSRHFS